MTWTPILPGSTAYPDLLLEWAPTSLPSAETPTWVDITDRLREWEWSYGRNDELAEFEPGSGYVILDNQDRAFDASYAAGPWFGNIKPRRLFRLRARWATVEYPIFLGHARSFPQSYPGTVDKLVRVELADDLARLRAVDLDALGFNRPAELSSERVEAVLDEADIPDSRRDIDDGAIVVEAVTAATESNDPASIGTALEQLKTVVEDSEGWPLYVSRAGKVTTV